MGAFGPVRTRRRTGVTPVRATMCGVKSLAIKTVVNAIALAVAALVIKGIDIGQHGHHDSLAARIGSLIIVAIIFGVINAVLKPVLKLFSLPFIILTLGLFTLVINAFLLQLLSWIAGGLHLAFYVQNFFWDAVLGAIIITLVSMILNVLLPDGKDA